MEDRHTIITALNPATAQQAAAALDAAEHPEVAAAGGEDAAANGAGSGREQQLAAVTHDGVGRSYAAIFDGHNGAGAAETAGMTHCFTLLLLGVPALVTMLVFFVSETVHHLLHSGTYLFAAATGFYVRSGNRCFCVASALHTTLACSKSNVRWLFGVHPARTLLYMSLAATAALQLFVFQPLALALFLYSTTTFARSFPLQLASCTCCWPLTQLCGCIAGRRDRQQWSSRRRQQLARH
jgi:hypothetical protein